VISKQRTATAFALAFVAAAARDLKKQDGKVDHQLWVARAVADRVTYTNIGTKVSKTTKIR
jgi:hypothetical protein